MADVLAIRPSFHAHPEPDPVAACTGQDRLLGVLVALEWDGEERGRERRVREPAALALVPRLEVRALALRVAVPSRPATRQFAIQSPEGRGEQSPHLHIAHARRGVSLRRPQDVHSRRTARPRVALRAERSSRCTSAALRASGLAEGRTMPSGRSNGGIGLGFRQSSRCGGGEVLQMSPMMGRFYLNVPVWFNWHEDLASDADALTERCPGDPHAVS